MGSIARTLRSGVRGGLDAARIGRAVERFDDDGLVCLTYDDGPDPVGTTAVLEELGRRGARATFFVMANRIASGASTLHEVLAEGHEIGLHGPDHRDLGRVGARQVRQLLLDARSRVEDEAQVPVRWFRPPYVALRVDGWAALRGAGLEFVASGSAIRDWVAEIDDTTRIEEWRAAFTPGDVVLAHDSWAGPEDNALPSAEPVVDRGWLCARALDLVEERGLHAVTLGEAEGRATPQRRVRVALRPTG